MVALLIAAVFSWALQPIAINLGWVDQSNHRKIHSGEVPLVGGLAIFLASCAAVIIYIDQGEGLMPLCFGAALVLVGGLIDDRWTLSAGIRFLVQICACLTMTLLGEVVLSNMGHLFFAQLLSLGWLAIPITIFSAVGVINAFNMIDGMDGLSGAVFIVAAGSMSWLAAGVGRSDDQMVLLIATAATLGFTLLNARFPWNRTARVFLGDSGSTLLGFVLAWYLIDLSQGPNRAFAPITAVWLFALPLLDTGYLMIKRFQDGKSLVAADQEHLHHLFLRSGFGVTKTWSLMMIISASLAAIGLLGELQNWPEHLRFYSFIALAAAYCIGMSRVRKSKRFLGRALAERTLAKQ